MKEKTFYEEQIKIYTSKARKAPHKTPFLYAIKIYEELLNK